MSGKVRQEKGKSHEKSTRLLRDFSETHEEPKLQAAQQLFFDRYRVDRHNEQLWRGNRIIPLTAKAFAVLCYLVEHAGQLVTKAELFAALWPGTAVSDGALTFCIVEIRKALGDDAKAPRFIETVHRRGYRFIVPFPISQPPSQQSKVKSQKPSPASSARHPAPTLVGRESELAQLHHWLDKALSGERQLIFVTGEPGIGKTALVDAFRQRLETGDKSFSSHAAHLKPLGPRVWFGRGQCVEQYGAGEAYMPILEALGRLCRKPGGERLLELLGQHAPTWLAQMPALLSGAELEALQRKTAGATRERMLREMAEAIDAVTAERPLALWLEDLHWSDASTLELLALLARRREPARLLVLGTYRPVDVLVREHPLRAVKQELQPHGLCEELPLGLLRERHIAEYLAARFVVPSPALPREGPGEGLSPVALRGLAGLIHHRTDGNPLFMVNVVDYLGRQGVLTEGDREWELQGGLEKVKSGIPDGLQQLIERQLERLSAEDRRVLEGAGVAGVEFSAAAVAAGVGGETEAVEERCTELARQERFLRASGTVDWPDGTVATRYAFLHALYQEVLYERIPARRRQRLHQQIGERKEQAYGERAREIAAELAVHFEQGRDYRKAVQYLQQAGQNAVHRSAHQEAITHLTKGLALLKLFPDTPERIQQELTLQLALYDALVTVKGYTAPEVEKAVTRARALFQQLGETPQLFPVLWRLWLFYVNRGELRTALELAEQLLRLAQSVLDRDLLSLAREALGVTLHHHGELTSARTHMEQALALYDPRTHPRLTIGTADPRINCLSYTAEILWYLGYPDQALKRSQEVGALAEELSHLYSLAFTLGHAAWFHLLRREEQVARERAEAAITLSTEQGFPSRLAIGTMVRGGALAEQGQVEEGIAQMQQSLAAFRAMGAEVAWIGLLPWLAAAYAKAGQVEEGLSVVAEALAFVDSTGVRVGEAELYRLKGELTLSQSSVQSLAFSVPKEAEECFLKAIEIARKQQAKSLELRAGMSLSRLWQQQGKKDEAQRMLAEICSWFTEGFDAKDLQEAKVLLEELA